MANYIIVYRGGRKPQSREDGAEHMKKWQAWLVNLGGAVVNPGTPLGKSKFISAAGITDDGPEPMSGFSVVEADSMEAALEMAKACPTLELDGTLEVAEMMKMP